MQVKPLRTDLKKYLATRSLTKKFNKQIKFLQGNLRHPSLNIEKLEPKHGDLYSFRIDKKYRAIFALDITGEMEILDINDHYQ
ncbi:MAG: hypothetical protein Q7S79_03655 [bacterium]|nr:hypothetical protein [bacterium]